MNVKEVYNDLIKKELTLDDFGTIVELKNQCMLEMNQEYYYLCDSLIVDIYINEKLYDDALKICIKHINSIDSIVFKKIYLSFLERAIYILIQKKNYKSAYRYAYMKSKVIDLDNIDEVNRWYLEMAYIYAALNQKDKALLNLKAILNNYPSDYLKSYALSNITKLYIDQNMIAEAKDTLNECIALVYKLNDEEGITYCEYLNAKLYVLEGNFRLARQSFQDIFKNLHQLSDDYLSIANEYISLLIEMGLYNEAYRFSIKYIKSVEKSRDLYIKKDFYRNYLKIYILKNKSLREEVRELLSAIEILEEEIEKSDQLLFNETSEDDKYLEVQSRLHDLLSKLERTVNITNLALQNETERECLLEFSKALEEEVGFGGALFVFLAGNDSEIFPGYFENYNMIKTYEYKKQRLYEREFSFNNLAGTVVEMLINASHEVALDFNETPIPVKNLLTEKTYAEEGVKALYALPLSKDKE
ncbi:MAG: tetratricopeptide repeat protein, partial [Bacilli bacterium]